jgi:tetratricopeptide (TPR) repeat protein
MSPAFDIADRLLEEATHDAEIDVKRRPIVLGMGGATALGLVWPGLALETARHGLALSAAADSADATADEWQEIVWEHGRAYWTDAPTDVLDRLMVDLLALQQAAGRDPADTAARELRRTGAYLGGFTAMAVANLGDLRQSRRWWRTAKRLADKSGDHGASVWVRGRAVVRALYERRPTEAILDDIAEAEAISVRAPAASLPELVGGKAQALAVAGRAADAERALEEYRAVLSTLPAATRADSDSVFGWPEARLRHTESFVYSYLGAYDQADAAQRRAIDLYPASYPRGPAQIELLRALCLVTSGDASAGAGHALGVLTGLRADDRVRPVVDLGHRVLAAVPAAELRRPQVAELRKHLAASASA